MRREGVELRISRPRVLYGEDADGKRTEPYETVVIDVDDEHSGTVVEKMQIRKADLTDMRPSGGGKTRITFSGPSRGLIGYHGEFLSRSEEHTSELQSLMRISYAVFCLKKKKLIIQI